MNKHPRMSSFRDRIQVAVARRICTDPDASDRLRHKLADETPTEVGLPLMLADEEPTQPMQRPALR